MGDQMVMYGELLKELQSTKVGEFYSSCLHIRSHFSPSLPAASNVEAHTFNLADGCLLGMGTTREALGGDGTAEFSFNVAREVPRHTHPITIVEV